MPFALDSNADSIEITDAVNYLLANFGANMAADPVSGEITGPTGIVIAYLYKFLAVKYADSSDGSLNFSDLPTNRLYYGLRNNNDAAESSNPADYIWRKVAGGGFGLTNLLWYQTTGGRQIQIAVAATAPDVGWVSDTGASIDLDIITSGTTPPIVESFIAYFTPTILQVPRSGSPLVPSFTGIVPQMYATDKNAIVAFTDAQTDTAVSFVNNSWRIGNSAITGNADISYTNLTIGSPTDAGDFAQWPSPTAMSNSPAYITVPVRYKNSLGVVSQAAVATLQLVFADPGTQGIQGANIDINGYTSFTKNVAGAYTPTNATLSALIQNVLSPTYSWAISGATPTSSTASSVVVTPTSSSTGVNVTLTVNGSNLTSPLVKTVKMPIVYNGATGAAGANGVMSAFPSIYIWTGSAVPPTRPTTTSTYTWSTGAYTTPAGWSREAPSNTVAGNYLWSITIPLNASATTTTSPLNWTSTSYPIRCIAYNGANGIVGLNGNRTAALDMYQWSSIAPISFPSGTSTYDWATDTFTAPATPNGWSLIPPAPVSGQILYVCRQLYGDSLSTTTSSVDWSESTSYDFPSVTTTGTRTAFLELYQWANAAPATFPVGISTYTWATGSFTAPTTPNGWSRNPGATAPGLTLWACQVSLTDSGTTLTTDITWTATTAYSVGFGGSSNGAATFLVTRVANDSSAPTDAEVIAVINRPPVAGDIVTVSYNASNNAVVYRYTNTWITQATYITGSLIVDNTITGDKVVANTISVGKIENNTSSLFNSYITFGLGTNVSIGGYMAGGAFQSSSISYTGLLAANTAGGDAFGAGTTSTNINGSAIGAVGYANSAFSTYRTRGLIGNGESAGIFQTGGANNIQTSISAEIRLARYTGGVSYAYYIVSGAAYPFTAGHDGLQLLTENVPEIGDIMVDVALIAADSIENTITQMSPCSSVNQKGAIGVFVGVCGADFVPTALGMSVPDDQGALLDLVFKPEYANTYDTYRPIAVNAVGEGKINVCGMGGDIAIGDLIVCSSIPGKGMKQNDDSLQSYTVAKSRQAVTFSSPTEVKQIACIYLGG